jgi:hypothetical protein
MEGKKHHLSNKIVRTWTHSERELLRNIWSKNLLIGMKQPEDETQKIITTELTVQTQRDYPKPSGNN